MTTEWLHDGIIRLADAFPPGSWLSNAFTIKALLALTFVGLICGAVGCLVVGNRMAFFSDALAHCAFAGVTLGVLVSLVTRHAAMESWLVPTVMVAFGIAVGLGIAYIRENSGLASDTVIGVFFALAVGFGAMFLAAISRSTFKDPENFLFGSPTAVYEHEILTLAGLTLALALMLSLSYNSIMLASFNASLARSRGVPVRLWNYTFIVMLALIVNLSLRVVGALLINALLVVPAAAAANLGTNARQMFRWGLFFSVAAALGGYWLSATTELPLPGGNALPLSPSGTIIVLCVAVFFATFAWRLMREPPAANRLHHLTPRTTVEGQVKDFIVCFTSIFYEALPFIVLGSIIAGVLEHAVPSRLVTRFIPRNRTLAIGLGCLLGLVFPMCECGIVPVMRRLLRKGVPLSACVAYMMAGPVINPIVILSTAVAFLAWPAGWLIVILRVAMAFVVAFVTAHVIDRQHQRYGNELLVPLARPSEKDETDTNGERLGIGELISRIAGTALHDFVDITVFLTLGALLSAFSRLAFSVDQIESLATSFPALAILGLMGLAIVLCLCSEADAFVAASFSTLPPAPKLAFLVLGPMLDIKLYFLFTRVFRPRVIWTIIVCVITQVFVYSMIVHYMVPAWVGSAIPRSAG